MKKREARSRRLSIRIEEQQLLRLKQLALTRGMTMTDIIHYRLHNLPIPDYTHERALFGHIQALTREINHIGNNINQVTTNLHILRKNRQYPGREIMQFNSLFQTYLDKRDELKASIDKLIYR
jgi:hypothetical protein